ncbi:hypothetical protein FKN07_19135 [Proteus mirabilis]|nr:hypothetical protein FKN07_19135 [Proteus mirabilis]
MSNLCQTVWRALNCGSETPEGKQTKWSLIYQDGKWIEG